MRGSRGIRHKTRNLRLKVRDKRRIRIRRYLQTFDLGDLVAIAIDPRYQSIPHPRFNGNGGRIVGKQGRAYYVQIRDGEKIKKILTTPEHLVSLKT